MNDEPLQLSLTKIAPDVYRIVLQSEKRTLYTANVEEKNVRAAIEAELKRLTVIRTTGRA